MKIETIVSKVYGKPCWSVKPGYGSFLTLEFGSPHLKIREPVPATKAIPDSVRKSLSRRGVYILMDILL